MVVKMGWRVGKVRTERLEGDGGLIQMEEMKDGG
jgi:hypothetical protein